VYQLGLTDDTSGELTLFSFSPVKREGEEITYGSEALIQSASVHHWVHCSDDFAYSTGKKGAQETEVHHHHHHRSPLLPCGAELTVAM